MVKIDLEGMTAKVNYTPPYPAPHHLTTFIERFVQGRWIGTVERKHGLFWTPNPPIGLPEAEAQHFRRCMLPNGFFPRGPEPEDKDLDTLFVDIDGRTWEEEEEVVRSSIMSMAPTAVVLTGDARFGERGNGVHAFWKFANPLEPRLWLDLELALIGYFDSDPCTVSPFQPMRVGGFAFPGRYQTMVIYDHSPATLECFRLMTPNAQIHIDNGIDKVRTFKNGSSGERQLGSLFPKKSEGAR